MLIGAVLMAIFVLSAFAGELTNGLNDFSKGIFALIVCWIPQLTFAALLEPMRWYFEASFRSLNIPESTRA